MINNKISLFLLGSICGIQLSISAQNTENELHSSNIEIPTMWKGSYGNNPFEQLMNLVKRNKRSVEIFTPDRPVHLIDVSFDKDGEVKQMDFDVPSRIDMHPKYTKQIAESVNNSPEAIYAAFRLARSVPGESSDISLSSQFALKDAHTVDAGEHGNFICYNPESPYTKKVSCMSAKQFKNELKYFAKLEQDEKEQDRKINLGLQVAASLLNA